MNSTLGEDENERMRSRWHAWGPLPRGHMLLWLADADAAVQMQKIKKKCYYKAPASEQSIQSAARSGRQRAAWNPKPVARRDGGPLLSIGSGSVSVCAVRASSSSSPGDHAGRRTTRKGRDRDRDSRNDARAETGVVRSRCGFGRR